MLTSVLREHVYDPLNAFQDVYLCAGRESPEEYGRFCVPIGLDMIQDLRMQGLNTGRLLADDKMHHHAVVAQEDGCSYFLDANFGLTEPVNLTRLFEVGEMVYDALPYTAGHPKKITFAVTGPDAYRVVFHEYDVVRREYAQTWQRGFTLKNALSYAELREVPREHLLHVGSRRSIRLMRYVCADGVGRSVEQGTLGGEGVVVKCTASGSAVREGDIGFGKAMDEFCVGLGSGVDAEQLLAYMREGRRLLCNVLWAHD